MFHNFSQIYDTMGWPLLACLIFPAVLIYLGLHSLRRGRVLPQLALPQWAAWGASVAVLLGQHENRWLALAWSAGFGVVGAVWFVFLRSREGALPTEALAGAGYFLAAAGTFLVLSRISDGDEQLRRFLVGEVLLIGRAEFFRALIVLSVVAALLLVLRKKLDGPAPAWDLAFQALLAIAAAAFAQSGGILLTSSYLLIPAIVGTSFGRSLPLQLVLGWLFAVLPSLGALGLSFKRDLPSGAAISCSLALLLIPVMVAARWRKR